MTAIISKDAFSHELADRIGSNPLVSQFGDMADAVKAIADDLTYTAAIQLEGARQKLHAALEGSGFTGDVGAAVSKIAEVAEQEYDRAMMIFIG